MTKQTVTIDIELVSKAFEQALKSVTSQTNQLATAAQNTQKKTQSSFKAMEASTKALGQTAKGLGQIWKFSVGFIIAEVVKKAAESLKRLVGELVLTSKATPQFIKAYESVTKGFNSFLDAIGGLITRTPIVAKAIQAIGDGLINLSKSINESRNNWRAFASVIETTVAIVNGLAPVLRTVAYLALGLAEAAVFVGLLTAKLRGDKDGVKEYADALFNLREKQVQLAGSFEALTKPLIDMPKLKKEDIIATEKATQSTKEYSEATKKLVEDLKKLHEEELKGKVNYIQTLGALDALRDEVESFDEIAQKAQARHGDIVKIAGIEKAIELYRQERDALQALATWEKLLEHRRAQKIKDEKAIGGAVIGRDKAQAKIKELAIEREKILFQAKVDNLEKEKKLQEDYIRDLDDFAQLEKDISRTTSDDEIAYLRKQLGLEETLNYLSLKRRLEQEGKFEEAKILQAKKFMEAQKKELIDAAEVEISFGAEFFADSIAKQLGKLWDRLPDWSKNLINGAMEAFSYFLDGVEVAWEVLKYSVDVLNGEWIRQLTDVVSTLGNMPKNFFEAFKDLDKTIQDLIGPEGISKSIFQIQEQLPHIINQIVASFPKLVEQIVKAIPAIVDGLVSAIQKIVPELANAIEKIVPALSNAIPKIVDALVEALPKITEAIGKTAPGLAKAIMKGLTSIAKALPSILKPLIDSIPGIVDEVVKELPNLVYAIMESIPQIFRSILDMLPQLVENLAENSDEFVLAFVEGLTASSGEIVAALVESLLVEGGLERIVGALIRSVPRIAVALVQGVLRGLVKGGGPVGNAIAKGWDSFLNNERLSGYGKAISEGFKGAVDNLSGWLTSLGGKIAAGWKTAMENIPNFLQGIGQQIFGGFSNKMSAYNFNQFGEKIWNGLRDLATKGSDVFKDLGSSIWNGLKDLVTKGHDIFKDLGTSIWNGLKDLATKGGDIFKNLGSNIWDKLAELAKKPGDIFKNLGQDVWDRLVALAKKPGDIFKDLGSSIWKGLKNGLGGLGDIFRDAFNDINPANLLQKLFTIDYKGKGAVENALGVDIPWVNFARGGLVKVPGNASVMGDSLKNDTVPAMLSPGELVVPRSLTQNPQFMEGLKLLSRVPSMGHELQFRYSWKDFKDDVGGLDPTTQPWWPDIPGVGKVNPWQHVKDNFWGQARKNILHLNQGGIVGSSTSGGGTYATLGGDSIDYDRLAGAIANALGPTVVQIDGKAVFAAVRKASERGMR